MTSKPLRQDAMSARVGFVVIGRNEGERLIRCFDSLKGHATCEMVYVDSGSTDNSVAEAETREVRVVRLDLTRPFTAGRARNEGFAALQARMPNVQYVQFVDGDCELAPDWISSALTFLDGRPDTAIACGRRQERNPQASIYNRLCDLEWDTPVGEAEACGGDALVRAASFAKVGGFDSRLIAGEEPELCLRLRASGWKIFRLDAAMTLHDAAMYRFSQWWMRGVRGGFGYAQVWVATRHQAAPLYKRELLRAFFWAGFVPIVLVSVGAIAPLASLTLSGIFVLQIVRVAFHRGITQAESWSYSFFVQLAKFPELQGALRFGWRTISGRARTAILYK